MSAISAAGTRSIGARRRFGRIGTLAAGGKAGCGRLSQRLRSRAATTSKQGAHRQEAFIRLRGKRAVLLCGLFALDQTQLHKARLEGGVCTMCASGIKENPGTTSVTRAN